LFLADRTNGRAYVTVFRPSVCLSVVWTECIVAKRCVLDPLFLSIGYCTDTCVIWNNIRPMPITWTACNTIESL